MSHFLVRAPPPSLSFMTNIGDTNHQTEDGINLVTSGSVTITAGTTSRPPIGPGVINLMDRSVWTGYVNP